MGGPRRDRMRPRGTTGPQPDPRAPERRWVKLREEEEEHGEFRISGP